MSSTAVQKKKIFDFWGCHWVTVVCVMSTVDLPQNNTAGKDTMRMINANVRTAI